MTKNFLGTSDDIGQTETLNMLKKERPSSYKPYTTTLIEQRKSYCSKVISGAIKNYIHKKKMMQASNKPIKIATFDDDNVDELEKNE